MKKVLKILFYTSIVLFISILFISKESTKQDEVTKVIRKQDCNISKKIETIEKVQEIQKQESQKLTVNAGDDQNITFGEEVSLNAVAKDSDGEVIDYLWKEGNKTLSQEQSFDYKFKRGVHHLNVIVTDNEGEEAEDNITINVGYWKLVKVEIGGTSTSYEYNNDKQIMKVIVDNNKEGIAHTARHYTYDEEGREVFLAEYLYGKGFDKNISHKFVDGKLKEEKTVYYVDNVVDAFRETKINYNENGDILKKTGGRNFFDYSGNLLVDYTYDENYHYSDTGKLLEIVGIFRGDEVRKHIKYQYENERLVSKRSSYDAHDEGGENYIYENGVLKEVYSFDLQYASRKFYNEDGVVEEEKQFSGGTCYDKIKYLYDEDGKKIKAEHYKRDIDGEFEHVADSFFDDEETRKVFLNSDKVEITYDKKFHLGTLVIEKRRDIYDEHGNLIEIWDDASNKLVEKRFYRFVIENY